MLSTLARLWCQLSLALGMLFVKLAGWCSGVVCSQPSGVLVIEPPVRCFWEARPAILLPGLGPFGRRYKVICGWLPLVLCLEVPRRGYVVIQLPLVPGSETLDGHPNVH